MKSTVWFVTVIASGVCAMAVSVLADAAGTDKAQTIAYTALVLLLIHMIGGRHQ